MYIYSTCVNAYDNYTYMPNIFSAQGYLSLPLCKSYYFEFFITLMTHANKHKSALIFIMSFYLVGFERNNGCTHVKISVLIRNIIYHNW